MKYELLKVMDMNSGLKSRIPVEDYEWLLPNKSMLGPQQTPPLLLQSKIRSPKSHQMIYDQQFSNHSKIYFSHKSRRELGQDYEDNHQVLFIDIKE